MNKTELFLLLKKIISKIEKTSINWYIDGSAGLLISGISVKVNDLDITTDKKGIEIFKDLFKEFIVKSEIIIKDLPNNNTEKIDSLILSIDNFEIECNYYIDRSDDIFKYVKKVTPQDLDVNILPLDKMLDFYIKINRTQKIKIIKDFLASTDKKDNSF